mmetsp:Transcript_35326/g.94076  ORF Transcript_35326/g.94076 Transcript_35326/m.94076 type:complete len:107 (-) Transcript_35326:189-509(-)
MAQRAGGSALKKPPGDARTMECMSARKDHYGVFSLVVRETNGAPLSVEIFWAHLRESRNQLSARRTPWKAFVQQDQQLVVFWSDVAVQELSELNLQRPCRHSQDGK